MAPKGAMQACFASKMGKRRDPKAMTSSSIGWATERAQQNSDWAASDIRDDHRRIK